MRWYAAGDGGLLSRDIKSGTNAEMMVIHRSCRRRSFTGGCLLQLQKNPPACDRTHTVGNTIVVTKNVHRIQGDTPMNRVRQALAFQVSRTLVLVPRNVPP